jgi:hypothetical protein
MHWPRSQAELAAAVSVARLRISHTVMLISLPPWSSGPIRLCINLLLHGAKWIGVAHAQNGRRIYWAMVIGTK